VGQVPILEKKGRPEKKGRSLLRRGFEKKKRESAVTGEKKTTPEKRRLKKRNASH